MQRRLNVTGHRGDGDLTLTLYQKQSNPSFNAMINCLRRDTLTYAGVQIRLQENDNRVILYSNQHAHLYIAYKQRLIPDWVPH